jgi:hypothetical protein
MKRDRFVKLSVPLIALVLSVLLFPVNGRAQHAIGREVTFPVTIEWARQKAVSRYRLQIAADEAFQNIYFDRRIVGNRYSLSELSSGYYYWRVAAADSGLGSFSRPTKFFVSGGVVTSVVLPNQRAAVPAPAVRARKH